MHHNCTARHIKRARLARGSLDSADFAISFVCEERYPVTIAVGRHLFPSRTQQLSPPAPMVLPWQRGGRVGRCRVSLFLLCTQLSISVHSCQFVYTAVNLHPLPRRHRERIGARGRASLRSAPVLLST